MARIVCVNFWQVLPAFLFLQGLLTVEGRHLFDAENHVIHSRETTDFQNHILALLLHKSFAPVERKDTLGMGLELANKLAELEQVSKMSLT
ncbi:hypothetical protein DPEC_G00273280 [Dallia pectoralis]|uniref:Uncharacterized protein n=1 Tax=Dallia pectoralis TaxID=75939 RepID=A0ACC2FQG2_DALPE|nr:hypothetical protein DPEC_G00273280 [Dallia pectoralis]